MFLMKTAAIVTPKRPHIYQGRGCRLGLVPCDYRGNHLAL